MLLGSIVGGVMGGIATAPSQPAQALGTDRRVALPPIKTWQKDRCKWISSKMGQANAQRDKLFDLRECKMAGTSAADKDIAGVIMNNGDFTDVSFENTVMSKALAYDAKFDNANFRNAVADRVTFVNASLKGAIFDNAVLTGSDFAGANLENTDFTDAKIDMFGIRPLCQNPTMKGTNPTTGVDTYESAGCFNQGLAR